MIGYMKRYGLRGLWGLLLDLIHTKIRFRQARIIRRPAYIRGKAFINMGAGFTSGVNLRIDALPDKSNPKPVLHIGKNVQVNDYVHLAAIESVTLKDNVLIASKVFISDHNHGSYSGDYHDSPDSLPRLRPLAGRPVVIEENVWIGEFVSILPGVTIGKGSIIGTMSVVTKDVPAYSIAVGSPAKVIKRYNFDTEKWESI